MMVMSQESPQKHKEACSESYFITTQSHFHICVDLESSRDDDDDDDDDNDDDDDDDDDDGDYVITLP